MLNVIALVAAAVVAVLVPPVDGPVVRPFTAPASAYGAGHRGLDFAAAAGTPVRAAAPGTVLFAGRVAGAGQVTVSHAAGLTSTYSFLAATGAKPGRAVAAGDVIGTAGGPSPGHRTGTLHFGVRLRGRYVDPAPYLVGEPPEIRLTVPTGRATEGGGYTCATWRSGAGNSHARAPSVSATRPSGRRAPSGRTSNRGE